MSALVNMTGYRQGRLTVISRGHNSGTGRAQWLCKCECGNEKLIKSERLRSKSDPVQSCGCFQRETARKVMAANVKRLPPGEANKRRAIESVRNSARAKERECLLTDFEIITLMDSPCEYCGIQPSGMWHVPDYRHNKTGWFKRNGIDRVNNDKGYINGNVVPACSRCNLSKSEMGSLEFWKWVQRLILHNLHFEEKGNKFKFNNMGKRIYE